jgi:flavin-dependent dehydrogenase
VSEGRKFFDLIVVGASFAGLVAARTAAMRGLSVAVIDRKRDAGHRVATTGILVKEAAEEIDVPHALTRRVHGVRLYAPNLSHVDLFAPGYFFLTTDTAGLLRWLADEAARAGATMRFGARFTGATRQGDLINLDDLGLSCRYLIGADGARSRVASSFGLGQNTRFITGLEIEVEGPQADPHLLHCFLDSRIAPGYLAWVAPGPVITQAGLAVGPGRKPDLRPFLDRVSPLFRLSEGTVTERRSGLIPAGGLVKPWAAPGVMLIGDAAGMVSPMTGGGIRLAFHYGRRAAHLIADHVMNLGPAPEHILARELPRFGMKLAMRRLLDFAPPNWCLDWGLSTTPFHHVAQRVYLHRRAPSGTQFVDFATHMERLKTLGNEGAVPTPSPHQG